MRRAGVVDVRADHSSVQEGILEVPPAKGSRGTQPRKAAPIPASSGARGPSSSAPDVPPVVRKPRTRSASATAPTEAAPAPAQAGGLEKGRASRSGRQVEKDFGPDRRGPSRAPSSPRRSGRQEEASSPRHHERRGGSPRAPRDQGRERPRSPSPHRRRDAEADTGGRDHQRGRRSRSRSPRRGERHDVSTRAVRSPSRDAGRKEGSPSRSSHGRRREPSPHPSPVETAQAQGSSRGVGSKPPSGSGDSGKKPGRRFG